MKRLALSIPILFFALWATAACVMNDNAATASMHNSDNRLAAEQARNDRLQAEAQAQADAQIAAARETTQQQLHAQNGASERLYAQSQYLIAVNAQNSENMRFMLFVFVLLIVVALGIGMWIYIRENPKPKAWGQPQYLPMSPQQLPTMPYAIWSNPRTLQAGWDVDIDNGIATHPSKGVALLEDKQL